MTQVPIVLCQMGILRDRSLSIPARMLFMLLRLRAGTSPTAVLDLDELAGQLDRSVRTVRRVLHELERHETPGGPLIQMWRNANYSDAVMLPTPTCWTSPLDDWNAHVPQSLLLDPMLSHGAKLTYCLLMGHADRRARVTMARSQLAAALGVGVWTVTQWTRELAARGWGWTRRRFNAASQYRLARRPGHRSQLLLDPTATEPSEDQPTEQNYATTGRTNYVVNPDGYDARVPDDDQVVKGGGEARSKPLTCSHEVALLTPHPNPVTGLGGGEGPVVWRKGSRWRRSSSWRRGVCGDRAGGSGGSGRPGRSGGGSVWRRSGSGWRRLIRSSRSFVSGMLRSGRRLRVRGCCKDHGEGLAGRRDAAAAGVRSGLVFRVYDRFEEVAKRRRCK